MKLILQQCKSASVLLVDTDEIREIGQWMIVYVCFEWVDSENYLDKISKSMKTLKKMKMFSLGSEKIDQTLIDIGWELLIISNFSIAGRMWNGTKVDFSKSAKYDEAKQMYEDFLKALTDNGFAYKTGEFGAKMSIKSEVYGPLNYCLEY